MQSPLPLDAIGGTGDLARCDGPIAGTIETDGRTIGAGRAGEILPPVGRVDREETRGPQELSRR